MSKIEKQENISSRIESKAKILYVILFSFLGSLHLFVFIMGAYRTLSSRLFNSSGTLSGLYYPFNFAFLIAGLCFVFSAFLVSNNPNKINQLKFIKNNPIKFMLFWILGLSLSMPYSLQVYRILTESCHLGMMTYNGTICGFSS